MVKNDNLIYGIIYADDFYYLHSNDYDGCGVVVEKLYFIDDGLMLEWYG